MKAKHASFVCLLALTGCGGSSSGPYPDIKYDPAGYAPTYTGTWTENNGVSGGITIATASNTTVRTVAFTCTLTGKIFGGTAPAPFTLSGPYVTSGADFLSVVPNLGTINANIDPNGNFNGTISKVPGGKVSGVSFYGNINDKQISVNFSVTPVKGAAVPGVANLTAATGAK